MRRAMDNHQQEEDVTVITEHGEQSGYAAPGPSCICRNVNDIKPLVVSRTLTHIEIHQQ